MEGKRWFDLRRMQDANKQPLVFSSAAGYPAGTPVLSSADAYKLLWPIDVNTLNRDPALAGKQNPGYE